MDQQQPPSEPNEVSDESKHLLARFDDMEDKQLDFLDAGGKGIIERVGTFLTLLFAITAFSNTFPPPYLKNHTSAKVMVIVTLAFCLLAMAAAIRAIQPRRYERYTHNLTRMRREMERILTYKAHWVRIGGIFFALAMISLAILIIVIIIGI